MIIDKIKAYFSKKEKGEAVGTSPEGTCPTCWGVNEWDGEHYNIVKDSHAKPGDTIYDSFISKVVNEHVNTTHNLKDKYICTTCNKEI